MVHSAKKSLLAAVCFSLVSTSAGIASAGVPSAQTIMNKVEHRYQGKDMRATVNLEILPKHGVKRLRRFVLLRKAYTSVVKVVTIFLAPNDVRNAAFLVWDYNAKPDQRWLYLPAIGQVRRIVAGGERQSFFGSDYVYEDITNRDPPLDRHKLVGQQKVDKWDCWVVDSYPKDSGSVNFSRYRTWVWKTSPIVIRQEFYDKHGHLYKRLQTHSLVKVQGIWSARDESAKNFKTGSQSRIELSNIHYNTGISDSRFAQSQLERGAPKQ